MKRLSILPLAATLALFLNVAPVMAGPPGPPDLGVMEPASDGCPWPDFANPFLEAEGVLKCLPAKIPWSASMSPEGGTDYGVRIVADPLVAVDDSDAQGWFVFWCQFRVGLKYQVIVTGLEPHAEYGVHAEGWSFAAGGPAPFAHHLGSFRTDASGGAVLAGVLPLPAGGYELDVMVSGASGPVLSVPDEDLVGFAVLR